MAQTNPKIEMVPVASLRPYLGNARRHSRKQIRQIADSVQRFGFTNPVLVSDESEIIAGHGRVMAAKALGLIDVPTLRLSHLSAEERRAYVLADNKLALNAGWDTELLAIELGSLIDLDFDVSLTGFSIAEIDFTLDQAREAKTDVAPPADVIPMVPISPVTMRGEMWVLGRHRLLCGDARAPAQQRPEPPRRFPHPAGRRQRPAAGDGRHALARDRASGRGKEEAAGNIAPHPEGRRAVQGHHHRRDRQLHLEGRGQLRRCQAGAGGSLI